MFDCKVVVRVWNMLPVDALSVHWHGLYQRNNYYMDGTSYITQCPIGPSQKFTYRFVAEPAGTHWYHSHHANQRMDGLFGLYNSSLIMNNEKKNSNNNMESALQDIKLMQQMLF